MNRMNLLYTMDGLLEVCKKCTKKDSKKPIHENCTGCQIYDQLRDIGKQLERRRKMTKITREEYLELKASGLLDKEIAKQVGIPASKISLLKNKWGLNAKTVAPEEVKLLDTKTTSERNDTKSAEYERLIKTLQTDLRNCGLNNQQKDMTIKQLESELQELKELCEEQSSEILSLKDTIQNFKGIGNKYESEIEELKKEIDELSQQPAITQDDFELLDRVREENQAMRQLLKLWM